MGDVPTLSVEIVNLDAAMAGDLEDIEALSFPMANRADLLSAADIRAYAGVFPEGYFVALVEGRPVGQGAGIYLDFDFDHPQHTLAEITGEHQCGNHDPDGAWYYGTDISVHPDFRGGGIGGMLYDARKDLVRRAGKRGIIAGASLPGFFDHKATMSAAAYVDRVVAGELSDPTLSFQISHGFEARGVIENYVEDEADDGWAALIVWENR
ncbi:MAG TPA: GNAT family N-acetyltransferase [Acidimicrobiia bacterium]|nr:GNAT family N-acetyltransferase [Acidimicrobiia bacterium]